MYQSDSFNNCPLYFIPTERFKTNTIRFVFTKEAEKSEISFFLFLMHALFGGTEKYPSERLLNIEAGNLYAMGWHWNSFLSGNYLVGVIQFHFLDERYTEPGMLHKSLELMEEFLFHPNVKNEEFPKEIVELVRKRMLDVLETEKENKAIYAKKCMLTELSKDTPISFSEIGYLEDYKKIDGKSLYQFYQTFLTTFHREVYVCGRGTLPMWKKEFNRVFSFSEETHSLIKPRVIKHETFRKRVKKIFEKEKINQSKLVIGCKVEPLTLFESQYVSYLYDYILGGGTDSFLFQNVRERHSLCYSISSGFQLARSLLIISAGIEAENLEKTIKLIQEQMKKMQKGDFQEEQVKSAVTIYLEAKSELTDSVDGLINNVQNHIHLGFDLNEKQKQMIQTVTKEDIMKFASKIHMDTVFLLEGVDSYEKN